ncbi:MAG: hypothetical protein J2P37_15670 [Ktedonobacteraceae bacterium]|nr:hypothetical protein [Ktedonobacteraceae bacterium]MBO0790321.1 hypothetical protein [Ktedonobacteraceae bacterium]
MLSDTQQNQQFDQLLDTFVACRSAVRYNSTLSEEHKRALIADIDQAVRFLRSYLVARAPLDGYTNTSPHLQTGIPPSPVATQQEWQAPYEQAKDIEDSKLRTLYRFYHTYLNMQQNNNVEAFVTRFNGVMAAINEMQSMLEYTQRSQSATHPLEQVTSFIADLYYMFVELLRALSETLEDNDTHIDTEELELSGLQGHFAGYTGVSRWPQLLIPLIKTYEMHQRLNMQLGRLTHRISDTTAFLEFLEERLNIEQEKREAIIKQLNSTSRLLKDLSLLLVDYEIAAAIVLRSRAGR